MWKLSETIWKLSENYIWGITSKQFSNTFSTRVFMRAVIQNLFQSYPIPENWVLDKKQSKSRDRGTIEHEKRNILSVG